jgi:large subunit ribosomal protein L18
MSDRNSKKRAARAKRKHRVRKKLAGTSERPRLSVFRSNRFIYAQIVDDEGRQTLLAASSQRDLTHEIPEDLAGKCAVAYQVGREVAERAREKGIEQIVFDRSGYLYHGRVAALARGAREGGLKF